jgi:hypothetical protein
VVLTFFTCLSGWDRSYSLGCYVNGHYTDNDCTLGMFDFVVFLVQTGMVYSVTLANTAPSPARPVLEPRRSSTHALVRFDPVTTRSIPCPGWPTKGMGRSRDRAWGVVGT